MWPCCPSLAGQRSVAGPVWVRVVSAFALCVSEVALLGVRPHQLGWRGAAAPGRPGGTVFGRCLGGLPVQEPLQGALKRRVLDPAY